MRLKGAHLALTAIIEVVPAVTKAERLTLFSEFGPNPQPPFSVTSVTVVRHVDCSVLPQRTLLRLPHARQPASFWSIAAGC